MKGEIWGRLVFWGIFFPTTEAGAPTEKRDDGQKEEVGSETLHLADRVDNLIELNCELNYSFIVFIRLSTAEFNGAILRCVW